jgi:hypothetical protein
MLPRTLRPTVTPRRCLCGIGLHLALLPSTPETASSACPLSPPCPRSQPAEGTRAHRRDICLLQKESSHFPIRREAIPTRRWSQEGWLRFNQRCPRRAVAALVRHQIRPPLRCRIFLRLLCAAGQNEIQLLGAYVSFPRGHRHSLMRRSKAARASAPCSILWIALPSAKRSTVACSSDISG